MIPFGWLHNRSKREDARRGGGFTLVELIVVVTIMSVLTGMMSLALSSARQDARIKRAEAEVDTITTILQQKINDINLAPVPLLGSTTNASTSIEQNRVTLLARRDLMRMKLPQCRADLIYPPARLQYIAVNRFTGVTFAAPTKVEQPAEWAQMRREAGFSFPSGVQVEAAAVPPAFSVSGVDSISAYNGTGAPSQTLRSRLGQSSDGTTSRVIDLKTAPWPAGSTPPASDFWTRDFESAECLYLILASTRLFGERALDQFSERSIANLDNDAVPEIIDPWGNPYEFIREPVGRIYRAPVATAVPTEPHPAGPDPLDYLRTDFRFQNNDSTDPPTMVDDPFRVTPLVISAGPDGEFGLRRSFDRGGNFGADRMGLSPRTSTAAIVLGSPPVGASLAGTYQYPDPYAQLRDSSTAPYLSRADNSTVAFADLTDATLAGWHGDGTAAAVGLGAAFLDSGRPDEAYGDNIASDDPE